jgi:hypothetical protein
MGYAASVADTAKQSDPTAMGKIPYFPAGGAHSHESNFNRSPCVMLGAVK